MAFAKAVMTCAPIKMLILVAVAQMIVPTTPVTPPAMKNHRRPKMSLRRPMMGRKTERQTL